MPGTYLKEEYELLATNPTFMSRVRMGYVHIAREVLGEDVNTPNHDLRLSFARMVITTQEIGGPFFVALIASDQNVINAAVAAFDPNIADSAQTGVNDDLILQAIRDVWSSMSGASSA